MAILKRGTISHNKPSLGDEEARAVSSVIKTGWIAEGVVLERFENAICRYAGLPNSRGVALSSGTASLYLALKILDVRPGDEVVMPTYVCSAVLNAVCATGAKPVVTDIDKDSFNITRALVQKAITARTKAVIVPHTFGVPSDAVGIRKLGVPVVEDCATALGSKIHNRHVGGFGDIAVFSFYASKVITTGQGGMLVARCARYVNAARDYREFDCRREYHPRFNFQMTDIQGAMGLVQVKKLASFLSKRREMSGSYKDICFEKGWEFQHSNDKEVQPNWYRFVLKLEPRVVGKLKEYLKKNGVGTIIPIERWELLHNYLKLDLTRFPVAEDVSGKTLSLPIYPDLIRDGGFDKVLSILKRF